MTRWWAVVREALASALSQPVASVVTIVMVAGMCATVLLTTGRTVGAEQAVIGTIDSAGTRSIVVRAEADAGLNTGVLDRLANLDGIEWAGAFGPARDTQNTAFADGTRVPVRLAWGDNLSDLGLAASPVADRSAFASTAALTQLGMPDAAGGIATVDGDQFAVIAEFAVPDYLSFLQPLVIVPQQRGPDIAEQPVSVLVVIAERPDLVAPVSAAVQSVLAVDDITKVTLSTSESLAQLRAIVEGQLGSFGRGLVIVIFALTAVLVAAILYGLVMLRRKDFGRRRALGASQSLIVALLLTQIGALALVGAVVGCAAAAIGLAASGDPLPGIAFFAAVAILAIVTGLVAALVPALAAARRDPLKELRVP
ncbi:MULTISPECIES: FtsX-like permease family protein [unclassified Cryobacterium]|uniref:FtsX-like permease family protein n=1 Tax=unclassified Cryobacterium TaxID=2649013 RepID=UPI001D0BF37A|nr:MULTISPECIES: FtsX-like permease family protein [unclassified Cryobacterium]